MTQSHHISDEDILEMLNEGTLQVDDDLNVWKYHQSHQIMKRLKPRQHEVSGRWNYVIRLGNKNRTIYRSKIVYMNHHRVTVTKGFHIDHIDYNNQNDSIENLRVRCPIENSRDNCSKGMNEVTEFFDRIIARSFGSLGDF